MKRSRSPQEIVKNFNYSFEKYELFPFWSKTGVQESLVHENDVNGKRKQQ